MEDLSLFPEGASIGGKNIAGKTVDEALEIARAAIDEAVNGLEITVKFRDDTVVLSGEDFTTQNVLELTLPQLLEERLAEDSALNYVVDLSQAGEDKLLAAAQACATDAKNATVSGRAEDGSFTFTDEQVGSQVDLAKTLESVRQLLSQKRGGDIQAAFVETQPTVTKAYLQEHFVKLSSYSTVSTNTANGNSNMALALSKVNGTILDPGEEFSYNTTLGDSTDPNNGWLPAGGISGGVIVQMYGGGICQGSSTLYIASLYAGMEIVERWCHAMPSSYCPIRLDERHHPVRGVLRLLPPGVGQRGRFQRADQRLGPPGLGELPHRQQPGQRPVCAALLRQHRLHRPGVPQLLQGRHLGKERGALLLGVPRHGQGLRRGPWHGHQQGGHHQGVRQHLGG